MPTILELYGQKIPGKSREKFCPFAHRQGRQRRTNILPREYAWPGRNGLGPPYRIIHEQYKYISLPEPELYDLTTDKDEKDNLFWKKNRLARSLDKKLMNLVAAYSLPGGSKKPDSRRQLSDTDTKHLQTLDTFPPSPIKPTPISIPKKELFLKSNSLKSGKRSKKETWTRPNHDCKI